MLIECWESAKLLVDFEILQTMMACDFPAIFFLNTLGSSCGSEPTSRRGIASGQRLAGGTMPFIRKYSTNWP